MFDAVGWKADRRSGECVHGVHVGRMWRGLARRGLPCAVRSSLYVTFTSVRSKPVRRSRWFQACVMDVGASCLARHASQVRSCYL